jgi:hypothetical protein
MVVARHACSGVRPTTIQSLPGCLVVAGDAAEEARQKRALLDSLVHRDSGIAPLSIALGHVATGSTRRITG